LNIPGVQLLDPANAVVVSVKMARGATKPADDDDDEVVEEAAPEATATEEVTEA
jgi:hypothetical protein